MRWNLPPQSPSRHRDRKGVEASQSYAVDLLNVFHSEFQSMLPLPSMQFRPRWPWPLKKVSVYWAHCLFAISGCQTWRIPPFKPGCGTKYITPVIDRVAVRYRILKCPVWAEVLKSDCGPGCKSGNDVHSFKPLFSQDTLDVSKAHEIILQQRSSETRIDNYAEKGPMCTPNAFQARLSDSAGLRLSDKNSHTPQRLSVCYHM
jgi:hypothetical protein